MNSGSIAYYRETTGINPHGFVLACIISLLIAAVIGAVYGGTEPYNTYLKLRVLATIAAGMASGWCVGFVLSRMGHVRPKVVHVFLATGFAIVGFIVAWIIWLHALIAWQGIINPMSYGEFIAEIYEVGIWSQSKGGAPVNGAALGLFWLGEFLLYVGAALIMSAIPYRTEPYCLACRSYSKPYKVTGSFNLPEDTSGLKQQVEQGNLDVLFDLEPYNTDKMEFLGVTLHECDKCDAFRTVSIDKVNLSLDPENKLVITKTPMIKTILVDNAGYGRLSGMVETAEELRLKMMEELAAAEAQKEPQATEP